MGQRLYPDPSAEGRVGIGVDGDIFDAEDADRLVGMGILTHKSPKAKPRKTKSKKPASPAQEG